MLSIVSLLLVVILSILVVRVATVALTLTGLSNELSRFQARSAFSGVGFTTNESEQVVGHPVRRRIIMWLILLGNAGLITVMSTLILSFAGVDQSRGIIGSLWFRMVALTGGLATLWFVAHSRWFDRYTSKIIAWALERWTTLDARDYAGLLHLSGDYAVVELRVEPHDWLADRKLRDLRLNEEGVLVLGIELDAGGYIGAPRGPTTLSPHDVVILYGPRVTLLELDKRRAGSEGNWGHVKAVDKQQQAEAKETERSEDPPQKSAGAEEPRTE